MFTLTGELPDDTGKLLIAVLEEADLPRLGRGEMCSVNKDALSNGGAVVKFAVYFTRQTKEEFINEMRMGGILSGITVTDERSVPSPHAKPYEEGIEANTQYEALEVIDPGRLCPYPSGEWRKWWLAGWEAAEQRKLDQKMKRRGI